MPLSYSVIQMHIERIHRAIRFIEDHLTEPITLSDVADVACYSLYHFCRTFNSVAHHSPYDYLIRRRLSEAARRLVEHDSRIIDVAFDYQFNNPETFSRAFKKMFSMQPVQFRSLGTLDRRYSLEALTLRDLEFLDNADSLIPIQKKLGNITVAGLMGRVEQDPVFISRLWSDLETTMRNAGSSFDSSGYTGVVSFPLGWAQNPIYYLAGVQLKGSDRPVSVFATKDLVANTYALFKFSVKVDDFGLMLKYIFQTWLPKSGIRMVVPFVVIAYGGKPTVRNGSKIEQKVFIPLK